MKPGSASTLRSLAASSSSKHILIRPQQQQYRQLAEYAPSRENVREKLRPPRPSSPAFFTGRPTYYEAIANLRSTLAAAQATLRASRVYPLPNSLPLPNPPRVSFHPPETLSAILGMKLRTNTHRDVLNLLNELHQIRYLASLAGDASVEDNVSAALSTFERHDLDVGKSGKKEIGLDEFGRAYAMGRRKESSARVWMVENPKAQLGDISSTTIPTSEVLVNHLPLATHFARLSDRETVLRALQITGLLGAYNIFALTRGGGTTGQAGAIALAVARALVIIKPETRDVLKSDGALMRDTRMVERKKTGNEKARKQYAWVKR